MAEETLEEAKEWLRERVDKGVRCPCCNQFAKVYKRKLNSGISRALIMMWRAGGLDWIHKPTVLKGLGAAARDESIARYWGLIKEETEHRPDGGRAGWWRITPTGRDWITGLITVSKYAYIYDAQLLRMGGDQITIHDALGDKFDYEELME